MSLVKTLRKKHDLSIKDLSHLTGIGTQTLYQYERGQSISPDKAVLLAHALDCMPCELLELSANCPFMQSKDCDRKARILELLDHNNEKNQSLIMDILESLSQQQE